MGNVHKDCEYYMEKNDSCSNYGMAYIGLAHNVSRHDTCIKEILDGSAMEKRIGELERDIDELKEVLESARHDQEQSCKIAKKLLKENNQLRHENNQLINQLNFKTLDDEDMIQIKRLNNIYDNEGFDGVVGYAKSQLCGGGFVREENGLICMVTAGWSENEGFMYNLNHFMSKFHYHLVCTQPGGAFYYSPDKWDFDYEIEIRRVKRK